MALDSDSVAVVNVDDLSFSAFSTTSSKALRAAKSNACIICWELLSDCNLSFLRVSSSASYLAWIDANRVFKSDWEVTTSDFNF